MANWRGTALRFCDVTGLPILEPFVRLAAGEDPKEQLKGIAKFLLVPMCAIAFFLAGWSMAAKVVVTDSMKLPSPTSTWLAGKELFAMHTAQKAQDAARKQAKLKEAVTLMAQAKVLEQTAALQTGAAKEQLLANVLI